MLLTVAFEIPNSFAMEREEAPRFFRTTTFSWRYILSVRMNAAASRFVRPIKDRKKFVVIAPKSK